MGELYAPHIPTGTEALRRQPDRIIFIDVPREKDVLRVAEEALKCSGIAAVICETRLLSFMESRRRQLAFEQSHVTGFIVRKDVRHMTTTACTTSWTVKPLRSKLRHGMPGEGIRAGRWNC